MHIAASRACFFCPAACLWSRWLNNAGAVTRNELLPQLAPSEIADVVGVNVLGSLLGSRAAIGLMQAQHAALTQQAQGQQQQGQQQAAQYHVFNCGFSSWGASFSRSACVHKSTKAALTQLSASLAEELTRSGAGYIGVHNLSPGARARCLRIVRGVCVCVWLQVMM